MCLLDVVQPAALQGSSRIEPKHFAGVLNAHDHVIERGSGGQQERRCRLSAIGVDQGRARIDAHCLEQGHQQIGLLFAVAEAYPQLRASESFTGLQRDLGDAEDKVAFSRQFYNRNVLDFNTRVESFPGKLIASAHGFVPAEYFETTGEGRAEVKLDLSTGRRERAPETPPPSPT